MASLHSLPLGQQPFRAIKPLHSLQSGFPPVPSRRFSFSMLFPVLQFVQT